LYNTFFDIFNSFREFFEYFYVAVQRDLRDHWVYLYCSFYSAYYNVLRTYHSLT